jgi:hypothetical protein
MTIIGLVFHTDLRPGFAAELTNFSLFFSSFAAADGRRRTRKKEKNKR